MLHETRVILSLIYRDYICEFEKKCDLLKQDEYKIKEEENLRREKYKIDFNKINNQKQYLKNLEPNKDMCIIGINKEKWYAKMIKKICGLFKSKQ